MTRIRFPTRIAHATDEDESARYALQGTLVTPEGYAVATDGRIAACTQVEVHELVAPTMIPKELGPQNKADLAAQYHANGRSQCEKHSTVKGQERVEQAAIREGRFPRVGDILALVDTAASWVLALNAKYLWRLAHAINVPDSSDVVVLLIPPPNSIGIIAGVVGVVANQESLAEAGGLGVIMPCDTEVHQVRKEFNKLRKAATGPLDAAAQAWSERGLKPNTAAAKSADQPKRSTSAAKQGEQPAKGRKAKRKPNHTQPQAAVPT